MSYSYTVFNVKSKLLDKYLKENPISISNGLDDEVECKSAKKLFALYGESIDADGNGILLEDYANNYDFDMEDISTPLNIIKAIVNDLEEDEFLEYIEENEEEITEELECNIKVLSQFELDPPTYDGIEFDKKGYKYFVIDFADVEEAEELNEKGEEDGEYDFEEYIKLVEDNENIKNDNMIFEDER